jgi:hypothetical protein
MNQQKVEAIREAETRLTRQEKQTILKRRAAEERARSLEQTPSLGEGPSKGKTVDPRNWRGVEIDSTELNVKAQ